MQTSQFSKLLLFVTILLLLVCQATDQAAEQAGSQPTGETSKSSPVTLSPTAGSDLSRQAGKVKQAAAGKRPFLICERAFGL